MSRVTKAAWLQFFGEASVALLCWFWGGTAGVVGFLAGWATVLILLGLSNVYIGAGEDDSARRANEENP